MNRQMNKKMNRSKTNPELALLSIALLIVMFAFALSPAEENQVTANVVKITGMQTVQQEQPDWVPPSASFFGQGSDTEIVRINGKDYTIRLNGYFLGDGTEGVDGHLYPSPTVRRFDTDYDGVLSPEELDEGTRYTGCPACASSASTLLENHPNGVQALPLDQATQRIADERWIEDFDGNVLSFSIFSRFEF